MTLAGSGWIQLEPGGSTLLANIKVVFYSELATETSGVLPMTLAGSGWIQLELGGSTLLANVNVL